MKKYIIAVLMVIILVLASLLYKQSKTLAPKKFPVLEEISGNRVEVPLILYVFFTKKSCSDCLEVIRVLNDLPPHFIVRGIVPANELADEKDLRRITGATFPLLSHIKYKRFIPWYKPSIVGVSPNTGDIIFTLPGVPGGKEYLVDFLESLYGNLYHIFLKEKTQE